MSPIPGFSSTRSFLEHGLPELVRANAPTVLASPRAIGPHQRPSVRGSVLILPRLNAEHGTRDVARAVRDDLVDGNTLDAIVYAGYDARFLISMEAIAAIRSIRPGARVTALACQHLSSDQFALLRAFQRAGTVSRLVQCECSGTVLFGRILRGLRDGIAADEPTDDPILPVLRIEDDASIGA